MANTLKHQVVKVFVLLVLERYHQASKEFQFLTKRYSESFEFSLGKGLAQMGPPKMPWGLKFLDRPYTCVQTMPTPDKKRKVAPEMGEMRWVDLPLSRRKCGKQLVRDAARIGLMI